MLKILNYFKNQKEFPLKSHGNSMLPLLYPRDVLYFKRVSFRRVKINDLIMVKKKGKIFTHRVVYKSSPHVILRRQPKNLKHGSESGWDPSQASPDQDDRRAYLVTKGDNNLTSDGKIYPKQIIGKVNKIKRDGQFLDPENIYLLQSTQYFQEIVKVKKALEEEKIDFVFLKGLPLHLYYEKLHPRRIYADCDVLIAPKYQEKADMLLKKQGFKKVDTYYSFFHKFLKDKETEIVFYKGSGLKGFKGLTPIIFDIHFEVNFMMNQLGRLDALYPQNLIDQMTEQFLKEKKEVKILGDYFPILSPINLIIYLSLHFFHHNFKGVFRLEFLDKIIRRSLPISPPQGSASAQPRGVFKAVNGAPPARCSDLSAEASAKVEGTPRTSSRRSRDFDRRSRRWDEAKDCIIFYRLQNFVYPVFLSLKKYYRTPLPQKFLRSIAPKRNTQEFIKENILKINIYDDEEKLKAGITRFKNCFYFSKEPFVKKIFVFLTPSVVFSVLWVLYKRLTTRF